MISSLTVSPADVRAFWSSALVAGRPAEPAGVPVHGHARSSTIGDLGTLAPEATRPPPPGSTRCQHGRYGRRRI